MTELSFLLNILMNHRLQKATKELIVARIKEVEIALATVPAVRRPMPNASVHTASHVADGPLSQPVEMVAQTPQTVAALQHRNMIMAGKKEHDSITGGPRKW